MTSPYTFNSTNHKITLPNHGDKRGGVKPKLLEGSRKIYSVRKREMLQSYIPKMLNHEHG
jgi:hypothetical protein